jgi:hypothetical protein
VPFLKFFAKILKMSRGKELPIEKYEILFLSAISKL